MNGLLCTRQQLQSVTEYVIAKLSNKTGAGIEKKHVPKEEYLIECSLTRDAIVWLQL
jgi:hypothetical protein